MLDDNELIQKFQNGDEKAFDQLVRNNLNNVFGFFMKVTRDEMSAEVSRFLVFTLTDLDIFSSKLII